jgi:CBS domain-containing protein
MPVVQGGRLVGVVTRGDLLRSRDAGSRRGGWRLFGRRDEGSRDALFALERGRRARSHPQAATPVREVMTGAVVTVGPGEPVTLAAQLMLHHRHPALPIVDEEARLIGILSEADILTHPLAGRSTDVTVGVVMTRTPMAVDVGATVGQVRALVADRGLRTVPVWTGTGWWECSAAATSSSSAPNNTAGLNNCRVGLLDLAPVRQTAHVCGLCSCQPWGRGLERA